MGQTTLLDSLCLKAGLTQEALAEKFQVSRTAARKWRKGEAIPHPDTAFALAQLFGIDDPADLFKPEQEPKTKQEEVMDYLNTLNRRELFALLATLPALKDLDFSQLGTGSEPDEFLSQANAAINGCKQLMRHDGMNSVESILPQFLPRLERIARISGEFQEIAAPLAVQAKILEIRIATHKLDFIGRKLLCLEAVKFGELASDGDVSLIGALYWQSDTYVYCYRQPKKARAIIEEAIGKINSDSLQAKSPLLANLSIAYAQEGNESLALDYANQARGAMTRTSIGPSDLDRCDGRAYLYLADFFPNEDYAMRAYNAFAESLKNRDEEDPYLSQTYIHKANAALSMGDLHEYATCLDKGTQIALRIESKHLQDKASSTWGKAPKAWQKEQALIDLAPLFPAV